MIDKFLKITKRVVTALINVLNNCVKKHEKHKKHCSKSHINEIRDYGPDEIDVYLEDSIAFRAMEIHQKLVDKGKVDPDDQWRVDRINERLYIVVGLFIDEYPDKIYSRHLIK